MAYKKQARKEVILTLEDLQSLRDQARGVNAIQNAREAVDLHFLPPKARKKKKEKKEKRYRER